MALPTGQISMADIRAELGFGGQLDLNNGSVRSLAGRASGQIAYSDLHGKSVVTGQTLTIGERNNTAGTLMRGYCDINRNYSKFNATGGNFGILPAAKTEYILTDAVGTGVVFIGPSGGSQVQIGGVWYGIVSVDGYRQVQNATARNYIFNRPWQNIIIDFR